MRRDALRDELRALAKVHPTDPAVRNSLAKGLGKTIRDSADEGQPQREQELNTELNSLAEAHPDDSWVDGARSAGLLH